MASDIQIVPVSELDNFVGKTLGPTDWVELSQDSINRFADVTHDHQFIHVDEERAKQTPFGGTIAHGYFTLSLLAHFGGQVGVVPDGVQMAINYGLNKVRFLQPVRSGKRVRARAKPLSFEAKGGNRILATTEMTVEIEGEEKPALIAESLAMFFVQ